jgi:hypothetical protein
LSSIFGLLDALALAEGFGRADSSGGGGAPYFVWHDARLNADATISVAASGRAIVEPQKRHAGSPAKTWRRQCAQGRSGAMTRGYSSDGFVASSAHMDDRHWLVRMFDPRTLLAAMGLLFLLSSIEIIGDWQAAAVLALWTGMVGAVYVLRQSESRQGRMVGLLLAAGMLAVVIVPVGTTLLLGEPVAKGELAEGDHMGLPSDLEGPVRVAVHAHIEGGGAAVVKYRLEGFDAPIDGQLERGVGKSRVGRKSVSQTHTRDTELDSAVVGPNHDIEMKMARGAVNGPLEIALYRDRWPLSRELALAGLLVLAIGVVSLRRSLDEWLLPAAVGAACFGIFAYRWLAPGAALRPELGALLAAGGCAIAAYIPWRWVLKRFGTAPSAA